MEYQVPNYIDEYLDKLRKLYPKFDIRRTEPNDITRSANETTIIISFVHKYEVTSLNFKYGSFSFLDIIDSKECHLLWLEQFKLQIKQTQHIMKHGENYEKIIKSKFLHRKLDRKFKNKGIKQSIKDRKI